MASIIFTPKYPSIQVHVHVHYIYTKISQNPHLLKSEANGRDYTIIVGARYVDQGNE
jgi:hypothetical protein